MSCLYSHCLIREGNGGDIRWKIKLEVKCSRRASESWHMQLIFVVLSQVLCTFPIISKWTSTKHYLLVTVFNSYIAYSILKKYKSRHTCAYLHTWRYKHKGKQPCVSGSWCLYLEEREVILEWLIFYSVEMGKLSYLIQFNRC